MRSNYPARLVETRVGTDCATDLAQRCLKSKVQHAACKLCFPRQLHERCNAIRFFQTDVLKSKKWPSPPAYHKVLTANWQNSAPAGLQCVHACCLVIVTCLQVGLSVQVHGGDKCLTPSCSNHQHIRREGLSKFCASQRNVGWWWWRWKRWWPWW